MLNNKSYDHILIKHCLTQYIEEDVAIHAGIPSALDELYCFISDIVNFTFPRKKYFVKISQQVVEGGNSDWAIEILKEGISIYPGFWEAFEVLGNIYLLKKDSTAAIHSYKKVWALNFQNEYSKKLLEKLGKD